MRTTRERATRAAALIVTAIIAAACAGGPSTAPGSVAQPREPLPSAAPVITPVPTPPPSAPHASAGAVLDPGVAAANLTPWPVASISAGWNICAIGTDQDLRCWASEQGAPKGAFSVVTAGQGTSCGVHPDGTVACWGDQPLQAPKGRFTALDVAQSSACGIRTDGTVRCWSSGESEEGAAVPASMDPSLPPGTYTDVTVGLDTGGCALRDDGAIACWASDDMTPPSLAGRYLDLGDSCAVLDAGDLECFGATEWNGEGPAPDLPPGPFVAVDGSRFHGCALRDVGTLACWGIGGYDDEGNDRPMPTPSGTYTAVTVGESFACALRPDHRALCWGGDDSAARPAPAVVLDVPAFVTGDSVTASWRGVPIAAAITGFDVEYTSDPWSEDAADNPVEPPWVSLLAGTTETSTTMDGTEGADYCWRVRAHDEDGIVSNWARSFYCTSVPVDDRSLQATGPWQRVEGDGYYKGTAVRTATRGATLLISQEGASGLVILATTCGGCGSFVLRYPAEFCGDDEEEATAPPSCPPGEELVELRGALHESAIAFMGNGGQEGYMGPLELVVTSSGKPVIIDGVIFADTE
jgi:hypothetical protein